MREMGEKYNNNIKKGTITFSKFNKRQNTLDEYSNSFSSK